MLSGELVRVRRENYGVWCRLVENVSRCRIDGVLDFEGEYDHLCMWARQLALNFRLMHIENVMIIGVGLGTTHVVI
jgi:hypothetical protein